MRKITRGIFWSLLLTSLVASGSPKVDPALEAQLRLAGEAQAITVVLEHRSLRPLPREAVMNRLGRQQALMRDAEASQRRTFRILHEASRQVAPRAIRFKSYWLGNLVIVTAPAGVLRRLIESEDVAVARRPMKMHLIRPLIERTERMAPSAFTPGLEKMRLPELWRRQPTIDGRGVRVGILDTGIDESHPDLKGKVVAFRNFSEMERSTPYDDHGHGTHVAGTIAGGRASGTAIGVAPGVRLVVGKIFDEEGSADEAQILDGMQWMADPDGNPATDDAPMLVSNSWGSDVPSGDPVNKGPCRAVDGWMKLSILPIFAAGNYGPKPRTVSVPAACPAAVAIGATDFNDEIAPFSARGPVIWSTGTLMKPLLSAPGVKILSTTLFGRYGTMSGTSMATPHVAGVAALVYQRNPRARPEDVVQALVRGAVDLGPAGQDPGFGWGRLDAVRAVGVPESSR